MPFTGAERSGTLRKPVPFSEAETGEMLHKLSFSEFSIQLASRLTPNLGFCLFGRVNDGKGGRWPL